MHFEEIFISLIYCVTVVGWLVWRKRIFKSLFNKTTSGFVKALYFGISVFLMLVPLINALILIGLVFEWAQEEITSI